MGASRLRVNTRLQTKALSVTDTLKGIFHKRQTEIIFTYSIKWLVFIADRELVYCAVRTAALKMIQVNFGL